MIGVHASNYHCDDVTGTIMLKFVKEFKDCQLIRTLDMDILNKCTLVFDIGGVYDHKIKRYDHHQRGFKETFSPAHNILLCGCGLLFKHYGNEIVKNIIEEYQHEIITEDVAEKLKVLVYNYFVMPIDANDNGIDVSYGELLYKDNTTLSARVAHLNEIKQPFEKAQELVQPEFIEAVLTCYQIVSQHLPSLQQCFETRYSVHPSGKILVNTLAVPWKESLNLLETIEESKTGKKCEVLYVLQPDLGRGTQWKCTAVSKPFSYGCLKNFPEQWRGLRNKELENVCGIKGSIFCHSSGFLACNETYEGMLQMAITSLESN
ncbi:hypothetical protein ENUP19_0100G0014 [Entamoeba nuttalli]|uniref:Melanocyte prolifeating protein 1, putative n=2 Tax=Entamoeba nuttalli TaxID=412467 RepID=K2G761_ENTNP|nr:melanocyte prolifeating protein 1, putative [Entamoeba nuttalli P19]EKE38226.1 melanocyte prolifeating protein 1, putative [Entamoeba nuttalli P19]|eukprot:XP_008859421.1 melanocyte prolifeating protein 1, putative [Entamoeba nuttalli P19]